MSRVPSISGRSMWAATHPEAAAVLDDRMPDWRERPAADIKAALAEWTDETLDLISGLQGTET